MEGFIWSSATLHTQQGIEAEETSGPFLFKIIIVMIWVDQGLRTMASQLIARGWGEFATTLETNDLLAIVSQMCASCSIPSQGLNSIFTHIKLQKYGDAGADRTRCRWSESCLWYILLSVLKGYDNQQW